MFERSNRTHLLFLFLASLAAAQDTKPVSPPQPDILIFVDGEKLLGRLVRSTGASVTFRSDILGEVTVDWKKVQELRAAGRFAVVEKDVSLGRHEEASKIPQGAVAVDGDTLILQPGPDQAAQRIPVVDTAHIIEESTFRKAVLRSPGPFETWNGTLTAGASMVEATQQSRTFSGAVHLVRAIPTESWLDARNRTTVDFSATYGTVVQPDLRLKTEIYHVAVERDEYFKDRVFGFVQLMYDHNFSQGLDLQQSYGSGIGWTAIHSANTNLDLKGSLSYLKQQFQVPEQNQNLFGSTAAQSFTHRFRNGISFVQQLSITATWNNLNAWTSSGSATLTLPVYKRLNFTLGTIDTFLNNPPPGFRKNSYQFTTGLSYALGKARLQ